MAIDIVSDPIIDSRIIAQWMCDNMGDEDIASIADLGEFRAFWVMKDGHPIAAIVWNWWRPMQYGGDVRAIIYANDPSWCLPGALKLLFSYPFEVLKCNRITVIIKDGNERSLKLCKGLGWRKEGVIRQGFNGKTNAIVMGMLKNECKWLNRELSTDGQVDAVTSSTDGSFEDDSSTGC